MRIMSKLLALCLLLSTLAGCGGISEGYGGQSVELFAATVGKGDALILKVDDWTGLIDTGRTKAMSRVRAALKAMNVDALDAVFLTHTDNDHAGGLEWLAESDIPVGAWYASAMYTGVKKKKHPAVKAAALRNKDVLWLQRGDTVELGNTGAVLKVLAPSERFDDTDDNNSLVMLLETAQGRMLFTGDMELPEEASLLQKGDDLACAVLKVPKHADSDAASDAFIRATRAQLGIVSTDSQEKPGTPDPGVMARLAAAGVDTFVTQEAGLGIHVTLSGGQAAARTVGIDAPVSAVTITAVVPGEDLIMLRGASADCDMTGWSIYSDRGRELYAFPDGYVLPANAEITIGTVSSDGEYDLFWNEKKVVHKSKTDNFTLYDGWGRAVDVESNGL